MKGKWAILLAIWLTGLAVCATKSAGFMVAIDALAYLSITAALAFKAGRSSGR